MQFEGRSTTVTDIVVDTVGKFAYSAGKPAGSLIGDSLPVVMDVSLDVRTKVSACSVTYL